MNQSGRDFSNFPIVWKPDGKSGEMTRKLMKVFEQKYNTKFGGYWDFHKWTMEHIAEFWAEIWDLSGIIYSKNYDQVIDLTVPMQEAKWFEGATLNFAENVLKYRDDHVALILTGEDVEVQKLTYRQLYEEAKLYAAAFRKFGVSKGDVIMCYMSNRKEAVLGMLATVSIGAIWTGALPLMGHEAVLNRMSQVHPKILLTVDRFLFNAEEIEMLEKVEKVTEGLPSLKKVLIVPSKEESKRKDISKIRNSCFLEKFLKVGLDQDGSVPNIEFEQVSFSYPVFLNFTSGTTGLPKALLHGCGMILTVYRDYCIHMGLKRDSTTLSLSPVGWATWCIFCTFLSQGHTVVLHEGSSFLHSPTAFWDIVDEFNLTYLLSVPTTLEELQNRRYLPTKNHRLSSLKLITCGGSVVKNRCYDFIYEELKLDVIFSTVLGCTELFIITVVDFNIPVHKGECPSLAFANVIETFDETTGEPVVGEIGELVVSKPTPGLVVGLWGDTDGSKYREKYYSKYPGKFFLGDYGIFNPITKGLIIIGRCDDTLKQRGCRIGVSEIYNIVDQFPEVYDSLCVSQFNRDLDERGVLFLKMREGHSFTPDLVNRIKEKIARDLTPRHVPDILLETGGIPVNMNGKKMELTVKKIINNLPCSIDAVANPESLKYYRNRKELEYF